MQTKGLPHGEDFGGKPGAASVVSEMRPLSHESPTGWLRIRPRQSERVLLLHAALPVAGEEHEGGGPQASPIDGKQQR